MGYILLLQKRTIYLLLRHRLSIRRM